MKKNIIIIKYCNKYHIKLKYLIDHYKYYTALKFYVLKNTFPNKKRESLSEYKNFNLNSILKEDSVKFYDKKYTYEYLSEIKNNPITITILTDEYYIKFNKDYSTL